MRSRCRIKNLKAQQNYPNIKRRLASRRFSFKASRFYEKLCKNAALRGTLLHI